MFFLRFFFVLFVLALFSCKEKEKQVTAEIKTTKVAEPVIKKNEVEPTEDIKQEKKLEAPSKVSENAEPIKPNPATTKSEDDSNFNELTSKNGVVVDIKYATKDNFTKKVIYPCGRCYLRPEVAVAIEKANKILQAKYKYSLKMFDCYRPRPAQQRLWDVVPNPDYVTPPSKGSMHNRGLAVDLTIVDNNGKDLDMGTPYDFFGKEAHTDNLNLPKKVLENRTLLTSTMKEVGLSGIRTEWWHFSYASTSEKLSDWEWPCLD
jgi:zinc D-Ala-D-Ala dipeptidase